MDTVPGMVNKADVGALFSYIERIFGENHGDVKLASETGRELMALQLCETLRRRSHRQKGHF